MKWYVMLSRLYHPVDLCKANTIKDPILIPMVLRIVDTSVTIQYHQQKKLKI